MAESLIFLRLENCNWVIFSHNFTLTSDLHNIFARDMEVWTADKTLVNYFVINSVERIIYSIFFHRKIWIQIQCNFKILWGIFRNEFEFCAFAVSANLKEIVCPLKLFFFFLFVFGGQLMTFSSKFSFCMPCCKYPVSEPKINLNWTYFGQKKNGIQQTCNFFFFFFFFYLYRKWNGGKSIQSFVVRQSNLVQKMSKRRFLWFCPHHSNQTLVFILHTTACKGDIRNNRRDPPWFFLFSK